MPKHFETLDSFLSSGRFGNAERILYNTNILYAGVAELIDGRMGTQVGPMLLLRDSQFQIILRAKIDQTIAALQRGDLVAAKAILIRIRESYENALSAAAEEHAELLPINITGGNKNSHVIAGILDASMKADGFSKGVQVLAPTEKQLEILRLSLTFLDQQLPGISKTVFPFVKTFAIVESEFDSAYNKETPMMFMINYKIINNPIITAEFLLHESLHQKLNDLQLTNHLVPDDYDDIQSEAEGDVLIPWGGSSPRPFSIARALATLHVYLHLLLYYAVVLDLHPEDEFSVFVDRAKMAERFVRIYRRTCFLFSEFDKCGIQAKVKPDAISFLNWMAQVKQAIEASLLFERVMSVYSPITYH
ncbi:hypothetical protein AAFN85_13390 [Mucilaginibacter sp. CAU 1740]|uniref:hypothetical protein n=1 Tax=Mucilaginibacter sp. CAU 1740 TaxID=3140365 RepID=UPI00325AAC11